jgi:hypothetical protein
LAKGTVLVKFVDDAGKTLDQEPRSFLGLKELDTVVVQGRVRRESDESIFIVARSLFTKKK